jgi:hypothetical protein
MRRFASTKTPRRARGDGSAAGDHQSGQVDAALSPIADYNKPVGQAKRFSEEIAQGVKRARSVLEQLALEDLRQELDEIGSRIRQVIKQTRVRIFSGNTHSEGKLSACSSPRPKSFARARPASPTSSARW